MQDFLKHINRAEVSKDKQDKSRLNAKYLRDELQKRYIKGKKKADYKQELLSTYLVQAKDQLNVNNIDDAALKVTARKYHSILDTYIAEAKSLEKTDADFFHIELNDKKVKQREKRAKALKKNIKQLQEVVKLHVRTEFETPSQVLKAINECKSFKEFDELKRGKKLLGFSIPGFEQRFKQANHDGKLKDSDLDDVLEKKAKYLKRKQWADRIAIGLTFALSLIGIGFVSAIAIMAIFPAIPMAGLIASVSALTLLGGIPEALVFHKYIKRFTRTIVRGLFKKIDDNIVNREIKKDSKKNPDQYKTELDAWIDSKKNRYSLSVGKDGGVSESERDDILNASLSVKFERGIKKALVTLSIPFSIAAGIGFVGLTFIEAAELFATLGVVGAGLTVAPWALALVVGPIYGMVMFSMINEAIKDNIFKKIKDHVIEMFSPKDDKTFAELSSEEKFKHIALCSLKALGITLVFGISVLATVFTAGAWLKNSAEFFVLACSLPKKIADIAGVVVGGIVLFLNLGFSSENSLNTASTFSKINWGEAGKYIKKIISTPKKLFKALVNLFPLVIHIGGMGAVASIGAEAFVLKPILGPVDWVNKMVAGLTEIFEEFLVDFQEAIYEPFNHDHGGHDHQHLDLYSLCKGLGNLAKKGFQSLKNKFSNQAEDVKQLAGKGDTKGMVSKLGGSLAVNNQSKAVDKAAKKTGNNHSSGLVALTSFRQSEIKAHESRRLLEELPGNYADIGVALKSS